MILLCEKNDNGDEVVSIPQIRDIITGFLNEQYFSYCYTIPLKTKTTSKQTKPEEKMQTKIKHLKRYRMFVFRQLTLNSAKSTMAA